MKKYNPDPQTMKDGKTIEARFLQAINTALESHLPEPFYLSFSKDDNGAYWATFIYNDSTRKIMIEEFTPAEAGRIVKTLVKDASS